jgi:hypothetical protein
MAVGRVADLGVVEADPLDDIRNLRRVSLVIKGGEVHRQKAITGRESAKYFAVPDRCRVLHLRTMSGSVAPCDAHQTNLNGRA